MSTPTLHYAVDSYGPNGGRESGGYLHGPSDLSRVEALEYVTDRMRDLADGAVPPAGWSEWGSLAVHLLDQADAHLGKGQDQIVRTTALRTYGVVVTAESKPVAESTVLRQMVQTARSQMEGGLDDLLRRTVSNIVGHQEWPGDVDPLTVNRLNDALEATLAQLIQNGLEHRRESGRET